MDPHPPQQTTRCLLAELHSAMATQDQQIFKIQGNIVSQTATAVLIADESGMAVVCHKRPAQFNQSVKSLSFTMNPNACSVFAAANALPIIFASADLQFRSCNMVEFNISPFFKTLHDIKNTAKATPSLVNTHVCIIRGTPPLIYDESGSAAMSFTSTIPDLQGAYLLNVVASSTTSFTPAKGASTPPASNRLFLTFDASKRSHAFPAPLPTTIPVPARIDAPASIELSSATFSAAAIGTFFKVTKANVVSINERQTKNQNCPNIQVIDFKVPSELQVWSLVIYNKLQFVDSSTLTFSASSLKLSEFKGERSFNVVSDTVISPIDRILQTPNSRVRPREEVHEDEEGDII